MLLERIPQESGIDSYYSAEQTALAHHLRDHLPTNREGYVSLAQLTAEHEMSVYHLQKLFKQVYGMPVYRYIKEYRLEQAWNWFGAGNPLQKSRSTPDSRDTVP